MQSGCVICQDRFDAAVGIVTTKCGHVFHNNCIDRWLEQSYTCPECRSKVCKKSLTKLFFNFTFDITSDNNSDRSLDALKEQLRAKDLESMDKDKKIKELQSYCARSERDVEKMHQEQMELQIEVSTVKREVQKLSRVEAKNQKLLQENNILQSELEHLNNVKTIVEGCFSDAKKILADVQVHVSSEEGKIATHRIATYCSVIKRELARSKEEKTQLQNELTQVKRKMGIVQADSAKKIRQLELKIRQLEEQIKNMQDSSFLSVSCVSSPIPVTLSVPNNNSSQWSNLAKSTLVCGPSRDDSASCEKQVTPITVDFPENKRQKLNIRVVDKEVPKISAQAPETPVLRLANSALPGRPKIQYPKDEDSVSRIGYNGLGGHVRIVTGSGVKKGKPFRKQII
ncbi:E3 ubiquitin-protein ligase TRAIP [Araneus ventricosus]|uniref:E3 ubiquitin-protein ligase TRAIP n=1 Tax=Araneus ventricosus TaxID=182803 RepID=A0A4Y2J4Y6_ARAVE|nr:E3 ubiquitin-protein ligase TRAIP [Araneus ventricosus]